MILPGRPLLSFSQPLGAPFSNATGHLSRVWTFRREHLEDHFRKPTIFLSSFSIRLCPARNGLVDFEILPFFAILRIGQERPQSMAEHAQLLASMFWQDALEVFARKFQLEVFE